MKRNKLNKKKAWYALLLQPRNDFKRRARHIRMKAKALAPLESSWRDYQI